MILLFSSDYYPVFKQDIFAIASLPDDYCYHFRYKEEYVSKEIIKRVAGRDTLDQSSALVIFVHNNKDKLNSDIGFTVIRKASIVKIFKEDNTDLYHVYFKLGTFVDVKEDISKFDPAEIPQKKYLGWRVVAPELSPINWNKTISKLSAIPNLGIELFFHLKFQNKDKTELKPECELNTYESYFKITEGKTYIVKLSLFDTTANKKLELNYIKTILEGIDIKTNIGDSIIPGVDIDDRYFKLTGLLLGDISSPVNVLRILSNRKGVAPIADSTYYCTVILFKVRKDSARFWRYFLISVFVFLGGAMVTVDLSKIVQNSWILISIKIFGLFVAAWGTARLFYLFNKK